MRSLSAKILAWFGVTLIITLAATIIISALSYNPYSAVRQAPFSMVLSLEMSEARHAWESGGRPALDEALTRFKRTTRASEVIFTDAGGTDLLSGASYGELVKEARSWSRFPFSGRGGTTFARFSRDGKYCFFMVIDANHLFFSNLHPAHLSVLAIAALLCYALAFYLTLPLRGLRKALDRFGRGDLGARA
ncbi:MAG TPA: hypothetical protein VKR43_09870, partial [Bryobacteraceae bacterium]|nr:hypothetical protein [Bryobacteraceae bacterium]